MYSYDQEGRVFRLGHCKIFNELIRPFKVKLVKTDEWSYVSDGLDLDRA